MAKRFQFRLATLLRVRELREREAKRKVAVQQAEIARLDRLNAQTAEEISRQQQVLRAGQQQGRLDAAAQQRGRAWIAHLRRSMGARQLQRVELAAQLQRLQALYQEARTQTRIIEKLRERRWAEFCQQRNRKEQAAADELAQQLQRYQGR
jgi:flagellar FliJ protein